MVILKEKLRFEVRTEIHISVNSILLISSLVYSE